MLAWVVAGSGLVIALVALGLARRVSRRLDVLTQSYWDLRYEEALHVCSNGLRYHPASEALLLRQAKILSAMGALPPRMPSYAGCCWRTRIIRKPGD